MGIRHHRQRIWVIEISQNPLWPACVSEILLWNVLDLWKMYPPLGPLPLALLSCQGKFIPAYATYPPLSCQCQMGFCFWNCLCKRQCSVRLPACAILKTVEPVGTESLVDGIGPIGMGLWVIPTRDWPALSVPNSPWCEQSHSYTIATDTISTLLPILPRHDGLNFFWNWELNKHLLPYASAVFGHRHVK